MKNKKKLKGKNIQVYIENDLSLEERKMQEKIGKWTKKDKVD